MSLQDYRRKRHFTATPEPSGPAPTARGRRATSTARRLRYVIHKHHARTLHYDFRLEWNGVLLSWAVPKGPSSDPATRRLAVRVEDHPLDYAKFEGRIPEGEYGAGTVAIWDEGVWHPDDPHVEAALRRGELRFTLKGRRLKGAWVLVRTGFGAAGGPGPAVSMTSLPAASPRSRARTSPRRRGRSRQAWLLIKRRETTASSASTPGARRPRRSAAPSGSA